VWLAWFLCATLREFADVLETHLEKHPAAAKLRQNFADRAARLPVAAERSAWDGDGTCARFRQRRSARFARKFRSQHRFALAIAGGGHFRRRRSRAVRRALESADAVLVDEPNRNREAARAALRSFLAAPGYIMGYPPGGRENGGQYTHGSLWLAMAHARMGSGDQAVRLLQLMNPVESSRDESGCRAFSRRAVCCAADVSAAPDRAGRCGWTWYTGSAAWMYRVWMRRCSDSSCAATP